MNATVPPAPNQRRLLIFAAWFSILLISELPEILCKVVIGQAPAWLSGAKLGFMGLFFALCLVGRDLRPLRPYAFVMLIFVAALAASEWVRTAPWWAGLLSDGTQPSFALTYLRPYLRDIGVTLAVLGALWMAKRRRSEFFLVKGQLDAPIEPVRWLGIRPGGSWRTFGWIVALAAALFVAVPTLLVLRPSPDSLWRAGALLPAVLLFAAINAFNEEIYFRATLLSTLPQVIGKHHALGINVALFGLAHYLSGSPPGMTGFLMTGFLAWILGKSMLETKGLLWAWFIHFLPDVVIFFSYAIAFAGK